MTTTTYDPATTASQLATAYTSGRQASLTVQTTNAQAKAAALTKLQSALGAFDTALTSLSAKKNPLARAATFSGVSVGNATATAAAVPGTYSFFVEKLASANQQSFGGLTNASVSGGDTLTVNLAGGASFTVSLAAADSDGNGTLTTKEIASAVNAAAGNDSRVSASVVTTGGASQLVLTSSATGADGAISLDTSAIAAGALKDALGAGTELVAAEDAVVWLGAKDTGVRLQQGSNTFTAVEGVSIAFTRAMGAGEAPVTLTVSTDDSGTAANVQGFIDAFNQLHSVLDSLTATGDAKNGVAGGVFSSDSGVRVLRDRLNATIRDSAGGLSLASYGVIANRDGTLSLDAARLASKIKTSPDGLGEIFGSTNVGAKTGVLGKLDTYLDMWTTSANGQISQRQASVSKLQASLVDQQATLDDQYNSAYQRYLLQFTKLQEMQAQMANTSNMFDALFGTDKST